MRTSFHVLRKKVTMGAKGLSRGPSAQGLPRTSPQGMKRKHRPEGSWGDQPQATCSQSEAKAPQRAPKGSEKQQHCENTATPCVSFHLRTVHFLSLVGEGMEP